MTIKINVNNFNTAASEEKVIVTVNSRKVKCIRTITCENANGYATVTVSYRQNLENSTEFFSQTAKDLDLSIMKSFQMILDSREIRKNAEAQLKAA